jgi:hypothetical protein
MNGDICVRRVKCRGCGPYFQLVRSYREGGKVSEEATRANHSYLLLSEGDAAVLIGPRDRREHLQEAYRRALKEENRCAI